MARGLFPRRYTLMHDDVGTSNVTYLYIGKYIYECVQHQVCIYL